MHPGEVSPVGLRAFSKALRLAKLALLIAAMLVPAGCGVLKEAEQLQSYDMNGEAIPSLNSVVGDRKLTGKSTGTENGVPYAAYTYKSDTPFEDTNAYFEKLCADGFIVTQDWDGSQDAGTVELMRQSKADDQLLVVTAAYEAGKVTVTLQGGRKARGL